MPTMPNGLRPIVNPYSFTGPGGVHRTEVAGGAPRYGLDFDRGVQQFSVTLPLKPVELSVWSAFYHHVIKKGAIAFDMVLDSGFGPALHSVNIVPDSYNATRANGGVITYATFVVEAESQAYGMTATDAQALVDIWNTYGVATDSLLAALAQFATVDTLVLAP